MPKDKTVVPNPDLVEYTESQTQFLTRYDLDWSKIKTVVVIGCGEGVVARSMLQALHSFRSDLLSFHFDPKLKRSLALSKGEAHFLFAPVDCSDPEKVLAAIDGVSFRDEIDTDADGLPKVDLVIYQHPEMLTDDMHSTVMRIQLLVLPMLMKNQAPFLCSTYSAVEAEQLRHTFEVVNSVFRAVNILGRGPIPVMFEMGPTIEGGGSTIKERYYSVIKDRVTGKERAIQTTKVRDGCYFKCQIPFELMAVFVSAVASISEFFSTKLNDDGNRVSIFDLAGAAVKVSEVVQEGFVRDVRAEAGRMGLFKEVAEALRRLTPPSGASSGGASGGAPEETGPAMSPRP